MEGRFFQKGRGRKKEEGRGKTRVATSQRKHLGRGGLEVVARAARFLMNGLDGAVEEMSEYSGGKREETLALVLTAGSLGVQQRNGGSKKLFPGTKFAPSRTVPRFKMA